MIVPLTKTIDSKMRVVLPKECRLKQGDKVYFDLLENGDLVVRKVRK